MLAAEFRSRVIMLLDTKLDGVLSPPAGTVAAFVAGVLAHVFLFRVGEWDLATSKLLGLFLFFWVENLALTHYGDILPIPTQLRPYVGLCGKVILAGPLLAGMFSSMLVYRGFLHRLRRFPGPFLARFSGLYMTIRGGRKMQTFREVQKLHETYGDVVWVGPQELSVIRPSAVQAIHATSSPCNKGPFYDMTHPFLSLQTIRSKTEHAPVRKVWDRAFSSKSLRDYEPRVAKYTSQLLAQLEARVGTPVNMTNWISFYGFDVMADLAFGKSFDMLKSGEVDYYIGVMQDFLKVRAVFGRIPWAFRILQVTVLLNASFNRFRKWMEQQVKWRMDNEPEIPDVMSWILADYKEKAKSSQQDFNYLMGECTLITIAGSDTTSSSLTCLLFELARQRMANSTFATARRHVNTLLST